jgi:hypothetical protein
MLACEFFPKVDLGAVIGTLESSTHIQYFMDIYDRIIQEEMQHPPQFIPLFEKEKKRGGKGADQCSL